MPRIIQNGGDPENFRVIEKGRVACDDAIVDLIIKVRTHLRIPQREVAKRMFYGLSTVQRWEQGIGTISKDNVAKLRAMLSEPAPDA
jgi:DNA-binding transcriptional regulator YiaG